MSQKALLDEKVSLFEKRSFRIGLCETLWLSVDLLEDLFGDVVLIIWGVESADDHRVAVGERTELEEKNRVGKILDGGLTSQGLRYLLPP